MYFTPTEYKQMIVMRTRLLRMRLNWSQVRMAAALNISIRTYQNYEYRSPIIDFYRNPFCNIVGITKDDLTAIHFTKTDIELFKWHDENKNCRLLRDDMRPNFVNGKLAPIGLQGEE